MIAPVCRHEHKQKFGKDRKGNARFRCKLCGVTWTERPATPLGAMQLNTKKAKLVLRLLVDGSSIRAASRCTGVHKTTILKLLVLFGGKCREFLDKRMRGLNLTHLQFDEQHTTVFKKQARLTVDEKATCFDRGEMYLWTCVDRKTKLMPSFVIGKRSADNARRFMMDVAGRVVIPKPHESDPHAFKAGGYKPVVQISTDGFAGYPEACDMAFGPYVRYGVLIKEYRNAKMIYSPSEMVKAKRKGIRNIKGREKFTICTSHIERLNGTQRLFMKRLNRLTYAFSKKLENLEAAFALFACYYNFVWRTRYPDKSGKRGQLRPTAAMMAGVTDRLWSFDDLFREVLAA